MIAAVRPRAPVFSWLARQPQTAAAWPPALPTQVFSCTALAHAYMMTPKRPNDTGIMQVRCGEAAHPHRCRSRELRMERCASSTR